MLGKDWKGEGKYDKQRRRHAEPSRDEPVVDGISVSVPSEQPHIQDGAH